MPRLPSERNWQDVYLSEKITRGRNCVSAVKLRFRGMVSFSTLAFRMLMSREALIRFSADVICLRDRGCSDGMTLYG